MMLTLTILACLSGLLNNVACLEQCGSRLCKSGQVCESDIDGGTCYNSTLKVDCQDGISYCYKPRKCCGVSTCCPENSDCCGFNTCCPKGSVCCSPNYCCERGTTCCGFQTCCASGTHCDGGECKRNSGGPFRWWYIFFFLAPTFVLVAVILRRRRRAAALRAAGIKQEV
ncbi:keratin-associated protein 5-4-like [Mercenaria mercenaria]|uniref:keratin-associated protein 5-4-like n=1 Tax=Mercenaria mercenaria TaxID=6596 RepID=UPI00234F6F25|nr:keratin-associated protein 5-4-like [Mercenaria mercenaria]